MSPRAPGRAAAGCAIAPVLCRGKTGRQRNQALRVPGANTNRLTCITYFMQTPREGLQWKSFCPLAEALEAGQQIETESLAFRVLSGGRTRTENYRDAVLFPDALACNSYKVAAATSISRLRCSFRNQRSGIPLMP